ncbi:MAG: NAD(P)/FAD-dependent oxidoreductase [Desulfurivibrionaceae bacterium]|nr:NAD(P)/FAD-dependent oxidoreductase [Desulfurivibrionaceae bacterium]
MKADHFHTIIIGAGPAGLRCARTLAASGKRVLVCEKNRAIGPKTCAGGVTCSGLSQAIPPQLVERHFSIQNVSSTLQQARLIAEKPMVATVNREDLGHWLAAAAAEAGATILTGTTVRQITATEIVTNHGRYGFDCLVGADGSNSLVRRFLGLPITKMGVGIQYHIPSSMPEMVWHLDPRHLHTGYCWIFPQAHRTSVGAYCFRRHMNPKSLKKYLQAWLDSREIPYQGLRAEAANINFDYQGWHFKNIFLAGDAAGLASGLTGEGILPAMISGEEIAATILNPGHQPHHLNRLIKNHQRHTRLLLLAGKNKFGCQLIMESLILALKLKIIPFSALEMATEEAPHARTKKEDPAL